MARVWASDNRIKLDITITGKINHKHVKEESVAKVWITLSMPEDFKEKFLNLVHNINQINDSVVAPVKIESVRSNDDDYAATAKKEKQ